MRLSMQQTDDDDYDLQAMGISDGFRPAAADVGGTGHITQHRLTSHNRTDEEHHHHHAHRV
jgi:hypothetical protein